MSYTKTKWVNKGEVNEDGICPALDADNLNNIEDGIEELNKIKVDKEQYELDISNRPPISESSTLGIFKTLVSTTKINIYSSIKIHNDKMYYLSIGGYLYVLDLNTGEHEKFGEVIFGTNLFTDITFNNIAIIDDNTMYCFDDSFEYIGNDYKNTHLKTYQYNKGANELILLSDYVIHSSLNDTTLNEYYYYNERVLVVNTDLSEDNLYIITSNYWNGYNNCKIFKVQLNDLIVQKDVLPYFELCYEFKNISYNKPEVDIESRMKVNSNYIYIGPYRYKIGVAEKQGVPEELWGYFLNIDGNNLLLNSDGIFIRNIQTMLPVCAQSSPIAGQKFLHKNELYCVVGGYLFKTRLF